jgi:plasmid stabilization system protein ParE
MGVKYHEAAEQELLHTIGYLELQAAGLGRHFLADVQKAEELMVQFPESGAEILTGIRRRMLRKFPYSLYYIREHGDLLILAVAHHRRRPGYWVGRVGPTQQEEDSS